MLNIICSRRSLEQTVLEKITQFHLAGSQEFLKAKIRYLKADLLPKRMQVSAF